MYHNHYPINILRCRYCIYLGIATMWSAQCHQLPLMVRIPIKVMSGVYGRFPTFHGPWGIFRYTEVAILWIWMTWSFLYIYIYIYIYMVAPHHGGFHEWGYHQISGLQWKLPHGSSWIQRNQRRKVPDLRAMPAAVPPAAPAAAAVPPGRRAVGATARRTPLGATGTRGNEVYLVYIYVYVCMYFSLYHPKSGFNMI